MHAQNTQDKIYKVNSLDVGKLCVQILDSSIIKTDDMLLSYKLSRDKNAREKCFWKNTPAKTLNHTLSRQSQPEHTPICSSQRSCGQRCKT